MRCYSLVYLLLERPEHEILQSCLPALESLEHVCYRVTYSLVYLLLERPELKMLQPCLPAVFRKVRTQYVTILFTCC
jgi:hypothetical protein